MRKVFLALVAAAFVAPAGADDGAASLATGGIVFTSGTPVRMQAEDLYISPNKVRVRFEFFNPTDHDVTTVVAFPLPDLDSNDLGSPVNVGPTKPDLVNFVGFHVVVDKRRKAYATEQRAFLKGHDITDLLRAAGMPVNVTTDGGYQARERALKHMPTDMRKKLVAAGAIEDDTGYAFWTTRTRFYWTQVFPAGKTTVIEHDYQPVSGNWNQSDAVVSDKALQKRFCIDNRVQSTYDWQQLKSPVTRHTDGAAYQTQYILKTAKTWNGPIGRFRLTLDKLKPDNVLSLCWDGALKATGPTTFEFTARDYMPVRDIDMAVLE